MRVNVVLLAFWLGFFGFCNYSVSSSIAAYVFIFIEKKKLKQILKLIFFSFTI